MVSTALIDSPVFRVFRPVPASPADEHVSTCSHQLGKIGYPLLLDYAGVNVMSCENDGDYTFRCPECDEALEVNDSMKTALVERGCVLCGAPVTSDAFTAVSSTDCP
jgi:hypothetical protein